MAYQSADNILGVAPALTDVDTVQKWPTGMRIKGLDPALGYGEFVYAKGVASNIVGAFARIDEAGAATLTAAGTRGQIGVSLNANTSTTSFSWYQVYGLAVAKTLTVAADAPLFSTATPGSADDAVSATNKIDGAFTQTADGAGATTVNGVLVSQSGTISQASYTVPAGFALVNLVYPAMNGNG